MEIFVILIALVVWLGLSIWGFNNTYYNSGMGDVLTTSAACSCILFIVYCFVAVSYIGAGYKADLINSEYGTSYTQQQVFFASDVIDTIRVIQRNRSEVDIKISQDN